jgi:hypothetical protein
MDYRDTEDFARSMEAASLRARQLRGELLAELWHVLAARARAAVGVVLRRLRRRQHLVAGA